MCKRFAEWKNEIENYCKENSLSFEKAKHMVMCENEDVLVIQYYDHSAVSENEIHNETPLPVVLWVTRNGDSVEFKQTEHTMRYISA